jgi:hypothetical protein
MTFLQQVVAHYVIATSGYNDTFVTHGYKAAPKTPEQMKLPAISVKSNGTTVYSPRFGIDGKGQLIVQFGHYYGGGAYHFDTILGRDEWSGWKKGGLNLYGGDPSPNNLIDETEMTKLRTWMTKHEDAIKKALGGVTAASYAREAARYMWFVIRNDGEIDSGWEYRSDGLDAAKEIKESGPAAKLVARVRVDKAKLAEFFKKIGVSEKMAAQGLKEAKKARME